MSAESEFARRVIPRFALEKLTDFAILSVGAALKDSGDWPDFELDAVPSLRRLNFLSSLMFSTWRRAIKVARVPHQGGAHVELSGAGFILSSVTRARMPSKVAPHEYRETLARRSQLHLWEREEPSDSNFIYALYLFGGHFKSRMPRFCYIAFPTVDGILAPGTIDLLQVCKHIVDPYRDEEYRQRAVATFIADRRERAA